MALIIDSGVMYAALDRDDEAHRACRKLLDGANEALVLPAATLPEVDYWAGKRLGSGAMTALLHEIERGSFEVADVARADYGRIAEILDEYADLDIGFVDASVIACVERFGEKKVATLDHRHFRVVRPRHVRTLKLLP